MSWPPRKKWDIIQLTLQSQAAQESDVRGRSASSDCAMHLIHEEVLRRLELEQETRQEGRDKVVNVVHVFRSGKITTISHEFYGRWTI